LERGEDDTTAPITAVNRDYFDFNVGSFTRTLMLCHVHVVILSAIIIVVKAYLAFGSWHGDYNGVA
jgi:hypothetical protein